MKFEASSRRTIDATVTSQEQLTIPAAQFTLEAVFGSVDPLPDQSIDFDREIEEALEDHAEMVGRRQAQNDRQRRRKAPRPRTGEGLG